MRNQFTYTLNERDYLDFNLFHLYKTPANKKRLLLSRILAPVAFMMIAFLLSELLNAPALCYGVFGLLSLVWLIFFRKIMNAQLKASIKHIKKSGKLLYQNEVTMLFEEDFFIENSEDTTSKIKYSLIERVGAGEAALYLYTGAITSYIIPNRAFQNQNERDELVSFLKTKISTFLWV